jgi:hypothetical protein
MRKSKAATLVAVEYALPKGVLKSDLEAQSYKTYEKDPPMYHDDFELWYTEAMGWVIPTLHIRNPGSRSRIDAAPRTYAVQVESGKPCSVGLGPHVLRRVRVHVRKSNCERLARLIARKADGQVDANNIRDRISTRRAVGSQMRAQGRTSWMW